MIEWSHIMIHTVGTELTHKSDWQVGGATSVAGEVGATCNSHCTGASLQSCRVRTFRGRFGAWTEAGRTSRKNRAERWMEVRGSTARLGAAGAVATTVAVVGLAPWWKSGLGLAKWVALAPRRTPCR